MERKLKFLWLFMICAILTIARCWASDSASTTQPPIAEFQIEDSNHPVFLPAVWRGKPGYFIVDTGSSIPVLDASIFSDLRDLHKSSKLQTDSGIQDQELYGPPDLDIGPIHLRNSWVAVKTDLSSFTSRCDRTIFGCLGVSALKGFVVQIDFDEKRLRLFAPDYEGHPEWGQAFGLQSISGIPAIMLAMGSEDCPVRLDTGSMASLSLPTPMFEAAIESTHLDAIAYRYLNFEELVNTRAMRLPDFSFPGRQYHDLIVNETVAEIPSLGLPFLSRNLVTFDFRHFIVYLKPNRQADRRDEGDMSGLYVLRTGPEAVAIEVVAESPSYRAGLRRGDVLIKINGKAGRDWDLVDLATLLSSRDGREITVDFRRNDLIQAANFKLRRRL